MRELSYSIKGNWPVTIRVVEREEDLPAFVNWVKRNKHCVAFDTENSGLEIYRSGFKPRLAQFGNTREAWVLPVEHGDIYRWYVKRTLEYVDRIVCHNASYDLQVAERCYGCDLKQLYKRVIDTVILAKLWDSRPRRDGGPGHSLEELTAAVIDQNLADDVKKAPGRIAKELKLSKERFFATVPLMNEQFLLYAGMDVIITSMLKEILTPRVPPSARKLIQYEHEIARICSEIERNGFLVDVEYTKALIERLELEEIWWLWRIEEFLGVDEGEFMVSSTDQVAKVLQDLGWHEFDVTPTGKLKVDDALLKKASEGGIEFAEWVRQAKKAVKWRKTWPETFLEQMDSDNRCHAGINTLQARTGRMSITGIPAQTLPSGDSLIRDCFIADPGHVICSIDYSNQELRVTAALSRDETMIRAFREGLDLHQMTADAAGVSRKIGKMTNFLTVYGGGWKALVQQGGVTEDVAKKVIKAFQQTYPRVRALADRLQREAQENGYIITDTGRVLRVDEGRGYSAMNYRIQSVSRDITAAALIRLDKAGYTPYIKLPIHDEVLFSFPVEHAEYGAHEAGRLMEHRLNGLEIPTDPEIGSRSWGSLYECVVEGCLNPRKNGKYCEAHGQE